MKKIYIKTFGCQANARDSEFAMGVLLESGFRQARSPQDADIVLFNSCAVRKHAEDRLFSNIAQLEELKAKKPRLLVGLLGCVAQQHKARALERAPLVDFVCGPGNEWELPMIIGGMLKDRMSVVATDKVDAKRPELFPEFREGSCKAYVSIGEGCDNFCSYCIVPYVRGRERSRKVADILREVRDLGERGFKEVTLLGQNVNSFRDRGAGTRGRGPGEAFVRLLEAVNGIKGIDRIRFMTSHPKDASVGLFRAMRDLDKVCEHLHLPLQSGSDRILKLMNRGYTGSRYLKLADAYRKTVPGGSITTDIIVGFPTETKKDFERTTGLMERVGFDGSFQFKYSPRPPARASRLADDVPPPVKQERLAASLDLQCALAARRNAPLAGTVVEALIDGRNGKEPGMMAGRSRTNKTVIVEGGADLIGKLVRVRIRSASAYALRGERI